jgi:hypothetical protein
LNVQHQDPERPRKPSPNHELIHHGNIRETRLPERNPPRRGFSTFIHALAFSTLLSSQETDAHLRKNLRSLPGQPLNLTLEFLPCQLRFRKLSGRLRSSTAVTPDTMSHFHQPCGPCGRTRDLRKLILGDCPGPGPPFGVPSPSGKMNSTADAR